MVIGGNRPEKKGKDVEEYGSNLEPDVTEMNRAFLKQENIIFKFKYICVCM